MKRLSEEAYKLKVVRLDDGGVEVIGTRPALKELAEICRSLSELTDEEAKTGANHYHFADTMNNAEDGSLELIILCDPNL